jgi:DNA-binding MarR family transcriptional regulator
MSTINNQLNLLISLAKTQALLARRFDRLSVHGLGFSDFVLLSLLQRAPGEKMRRIDLAGQMGLTASGVTRMLLPLEKIGLVGREAHDRDARVTYATLTETGKRVFAEALETANAVARDLVPADKAKQLKPLADLLVGLSMQII